MGTGDFVEKRERRSAWGAPQGLRKRARFFARAHAPAPPSTAWDLLPLAGAGDLGTIPVTAGLSREEQALSCRTAAGVHAASGWIWPGWIEESLNPASHAFHLLSPATGLVNTSKRNHTGVGTLLEGPAVRLNADGLVQSPWGPSLDWWVRGPTGWMYPSQCTTRQEILAGTPVVRTSLSVGTQGSLVHTVFGMAGTPDCVIVQVQNETDAPVALAFVVRPYSLEGLVELGSLSFDGTTVQADGQDLLCLAGTFPHSVHTASSATGDVCRQLEEVPPTAALGSISVADPHGLATMALVFLIEHGARVSVLLPLGSRDFGSASGAPGESGGSDGSGTSGVSSAYAHLAERLVPPESVVRGWKNQTQHAVTGHFPDGRATAAFRAAPSFLLLHGGGGDDSPPLSDPCRPVRPGRPLWEESLRVQAALSLGLGSHAKERTARLRALQRLDGSFLDQTAEPAGRVAGIAATVSAIVGHWKYTRDPLEEEEEALVVYNAVQWLLRVRGGNAKTGERKRQRLSSFGTETIGLLLRAFQDTSFFGEKIGDKELLAAGDAGVELLAPVLEERLAIAARCAWTGTGKTIQGQQAWLAAVRACWPHRVLPATHPGIATLLGPLEENWQAARPLRILDARAGFFPRVIFGLAGTLVAKADPRGWALFAALLPAVTSTGRMPSLINPRTFGGGGGRGEDLPTVAEMALLLRDFFVRDEADALELLPILPSSWNESELGLRGLPTPYGSLDVCLSCEEKTSALAWRGLWGTQKPEIFSRAVRPGWRTRDEAGTVTRVWDDDTIVSESADSADV